jgi:hypothetical protein
MKPQKAASWRTDETEIKYQEAIANGHLSEGCTLCKNETPKQEFNHWVIHSNIFPYDKVSELHDIIYPIRHTNGDDLTNEELTELSKLKKGYININYQFLVEAMPKNKSIPGHFHLHLIIAK